MKPKGPEREIEIIPLEEPVPSKETPVPDPAPRPEPAVPEKAPEKTLA